MNFRYNFYQIGFFIINNIIIRKIKVSLSAQLEVFRLITGY